MTKGRAARDSLPLVSIAIPVYNGAKYLRYAIIETRPKLGQAQTVCL